PNNPANSHFPAVSTLCRHSLNCWLAVDFFPPGCAQENRLASSPLVSTGCWSITLARRRHVKRLLRLLPLLLLRRRTAGEEATRCLGWWSSMRHCKPLRNGNVTAKLLSC